MAKKRIRYKMVVSASIEVDDELSDYESLRAAEAEEPAKLLAGSSIAWSETTVEYVNGRDADTI